MYTILLATYNEGKKREIAAMFASLPWTWKTLQDVGHAEVAETGHTFVENALQKAIMGFQTTGLPCFAEDSGLCVDALDGQPGVHSKRFSPSQSDSDNNALLIKKMMDKTLRSARYHCAIAFVTTDSYFTLEETCEGEIGYVPQGAGGFGYDPLFWPQDKPGKTMAELTLEEKNAISHRGKALQKWCLFMESSLRSPQFLGE